MARAVQVELGCLSNDHNVYVNYEHDVIHHIYDKFDQQHVVNDQFYVNDKLNKFHDQFYVHDVQLHEYIKYELKYDFDN